MNLIWHSNAPWSPTGYGNQTALFLPRLKETTDSLAVSAFYGLEGNILPWNSIPVLPGIGQTHGDETILQHAQMFFKGLRDGLVVTLMDVWVLDPSVWRQLNTVCWCPVDHQPAPGPVVGFFEASGAVPMAMSKFGQQELQQAGLDPLYVPHGIDTTTLTPVPKAEARKATGMPDDVFVVGMVAANKGNPSRKCFAEAFEAFKALHDRHPDMRLYVHAEITGMFDGVNLPQLARAVGIPSGAMLYCDQYRAVHYPFPLSHMANVYSSLDVLLAPSAGEGFGIPVVEAQSCGVPVIVSDFSAQPELCGAGWLVKGHRVYTPISSWQAKPDVPDLVDALESAYRKLPNEAMSAKARELAVGYDIDTVFKDFMLPALEQAEERFKAREPVALKPKKRREKVAA